MEKLLEIINRKNEYPNNKEFEKDIIEIIRQADETNQYELERKSVKFLLGIDEDFDDFMYKEFSSEAKQSILEYSISKTSKNFFKAIEYYKENPDDRQSESIEEFLNTTWEYISDLLWAFKHITYPVVFSLEYTKEDIQESTQVMQNFYELFEQSLSPIYKVKLMQNIFMGNKEEAKKYYLLRKETETDFLEDCAACILDDEIHYHYFMGEYKEALEKSKPILQSEMICGEVPEITYSSILNSQIELGLLQEANDLFETAKNVVVNHKDYSLVTAIIEIALKLGRREEAKELIENYNQKILGYNDIYYSMRYYIATSVLFPENYNIGLDLAKKFDERNENTYYQDYLENYYNKYS